MPVNLRKTDFGCGGAIHYPISAESEAWLLSLLPDDNTKGPGQLIFSFIAEMKFDGARVDADRRRNDVYVLKKPAVREWGRFLSKKTITSSQVIQMLIGVGSMEGRYAKIVAILLGLISDEPVDTSKYVPNDADDGSIDGFKHFLAALATAGASDISLMVDA